MANAQGLARLFETLFDRSASHVHGLREEEDMECSRLSRLIWSCSMRSSGFEGSVRDSKGEYASISCSIFLRNVPNVSAKEARSSLIRKPTGETLILAFFRRLDEESSSKSHHGFDSHSNTPHVSQHFLGTPAT
jgi:hypothetical protein